MDVLSGRFIWFSKKKNDLGGRVEEEEQEEVLTNFY